MQFDWLMTRRRRVAIDLWFGLFTFCSFYTALRILSFSSLSMSTRNKFTAWPWFCEILLIFSPQSLNRDITDTKIHNQLTFSQDLLSSMKIWCFINDRNNIMIKILIIQIQNSHYSLTLVGPSRFSGRFKISVFEKILRWAQWIEVTVQK